MVEAQFQRQFEKNIIGNRNIVAPAGSRITLRRQHCSRCGQPLAYELTDKMGFGGEYYVAIDCVWEKHEPHIKYKSERWFGNMVRCPVCGLENKLPMDKPLNWEAMQKSREDRKCLIK